MLEGYPVNTMNTVRVRKIFRRSDIFTQSTDTESEKGELHKQRLITVTEPATRLLERKRDK